MRLRRNITLTQLCLAVILFMAAGCHSPEPRDNRTDTVDLPGLRVPLPDDDAPADDTRPSVGDGEGSLLAELTDASPRFSYGSLKLRMDRGGVLFSSRADGSWCITDLDGASCVEVNPDGTILKVDGRVVCVNSVALLREYDGVSWYQLEAEGGQALLVVESL